MDVATWLATGGTIPVTLPDGAAHRLFVVHEGPPDAPDLVVLHGFPTSSWDWAPVWPSLCRRFRCLAMDFLGFGSSDKPHPHRYSILEQADFVEALLAERAIHDFHILAHDYGDTVAQELVARDQARDDGARRIRSVCVLNGGLFPEAHRPRLIQRLLRTPIGPLLARLAGQRSFRRSFPTIFGPATAPSSEELDAHWSLIEKNNGPRVMPAILAYLAERRQYRDRWRAALIDAPCPVQIINGSVDPVSGQHMVRRFEQLGGIAAVEELPDIGHYPQIEAPDRVLAAFLTWHDALAAGM